MEVSSMRVVNLYYRAGSEIDAGGLHEWDKLFSQQD